MGAINNILHDDNNLARKLINIDLHEDLAANLSPLKHRSFW